MFEKFKFWKPKQDPLLSSNRDFGTMHVGPGMNKDELGISSEYDYNQPGYTQDPFQQGQGTQPQNYPGFQQQQQPPARQQQQSMYPQQPVLVREYDHTGLQQQAAYQPSNRDLELVSAKLDSLRVNLDMINQRLAVIEKELQNRHRGW